MSSILPSINFEKWLATTDNLPTPDNMRRWAWYSLIGAALQRRVWIGDINHDPLFANMYIVNVGPPGIGKSLVIDRAKGIATHWKFGDNNKYLKALFKTEEHQILAEAVNSADEKTANSYGVKPKDEQTEIIKPHILPKGPDSSTYEALVLAFGKAYRRIQYVEYSEALKKEVLKTYGHASVYYQLDELASLLRKKTHDTVTFLLGLYNCPKDYEYDTISREKDRIKKGCLNILAATNPRFMQKSFNEDLFDEAFPARIIFIYNTKRRKETVFIDKMSSECEQLESDIKEHVLKLTALYGEVTVQPIYKIFIENWFKENVIDREKRASKNPKLDGYYARKNITIQKLAMALHFGESTEMEIPLGRFIEAANILHEEEKTMHLALTTEGKDNNAKMVNRIMEYLKEGERNFASIYVDIFQSVGMVNRAGLEESLEFLKDTNQIVSRDCDKNGRVITYWRLK